MSQYTTDEILEIMDRWYEQQQDDRKSSYAPPFEGFNALIGKDLSEIDLSSETIVARAEEYRKVRDGYPPWFVRGVFSLGIDLRGAILSNKGLSTNFSGAKLDRANLAGAILEGANLWEAKLNGADLGRAQLDKATLSYGHLKLARLIEADLRGASLRWAKLDRANFEGAILEGADLKGADLQGSILRNARLETADLEGANLQGAYLTGARLKGARLRGTQLKRACIMEVDLDKVELGEVEWGNYELYPENIWALPEAESEHRRVTQHFNQTGQLDIAGEFHRRELLVRRKRLANEDRWPRRLAGIRLALISELFYFPLAVMVAVLTCFLLLPRSLKIMIRSNRANAKVDELWI